LIGIAWRVGPRRVLAQVGLLAVVGLVGGANLLLLVPIVNSVAASGGGASITVPSLGSVDLAWAPLPVLLGGVVALTAAQVLAQRASIVNAQVLQESVAQHLRAGAYAAVLAARWGFVLDRHRSDIIAVVGQGSQRAGHALSHLLTGAVTCVMALVTAVVALVVEPALSAVAIVGVLMLGSLLATSIRRAYRIGDRLSSSARDLHAVMTDSLDSFRLVRAHDAAEVWRRDLAGAFDEARAVQIAYVRHTATLSAVSQLGLVASAALLVLAAVWLGVPPPTIVVVLLLVARLARLVQQLAATGQQAAHGLPAVRDITALTGDARAAAELPDTAEEAMSASTPPSPPGPGQPLVSLRAVCFRYPASGGGIEEVSFQIPTGRVTALQGSSGSGKSTTADIVLGLLEPDSGQVLIDGRPLTHAGLRSWRARVGYVPQETILVPGTLRRNLLWSVGDADDEACWHALDRAAATFARGMPDGLDTELGDRGIRLSGGERQRVAIARALLRQPDLLVLDEATSSLDDATEAAVLATVAALRPEVTVLVIAHRRSTIDAADHVVTLKSGRVVVPTD
jgi:ATP-binding cassette subfamily C protein